MSGRKMRPVSMREGPFLPFCTGYSQEIRHSGESEHDEDQGGLLAQRLNRREASHPSGFTNPSPTPRSGPARRVLSDSLIPLWIPVPFPNRHSSLHISPALTSQWNDMLA